MDSKQQQHFILGLDLGANSVGWALLKAAPVGKEKQLKINGIERAGVRVFDAGVEGDIESGRDESRGVERRNARGIRRRLDRNSRRLTHLFHLLQSSGLLPKGEVPAIPATSGKAWENSSQRQKIRDAQAQERNKIIAELDKKLLIKYAKDDPQAPKKLPYLLRAKSLGQKIDPYELGRALYHLGQRRGFLSNRKANSKKDDDDSGKVKQGILDLEAKMEEANSRTLGEYFSKLDPEQERIRSRWTSRQMYEQEFEAIWNAQGKYHSAILTEDFKKKIYKSIFFQRPLKIQKFLVGNCPYETDKQGKPRKRAPWALLAAQRFRMLQQVNNSYIISPEGEVLDFTPEQRATLFDLLEKKDEITFKSAKKPLGLTKEFQFNFEKDGKGEFWGNSTTVELREIFGEERWNNFSESDKNKIVERTGFRPERKRLGPEGQGGMGIERGKG